MILTHDPRPKTRRFYLDRAAEVIYRERYRLDFPQDGARRWINLFADGSYHVAKEAPTTAGVVLEYALPDGGTLIVLQALTEPHRYHMLQPHDSDAVHYIPLYAGGRWTPDDGLTVLETTPREGAGLARDLFQAGDAVMAAGAGVHVRWGEPDDAAQDREAFAPRIDAVPIVVDWPPVSDTALEYDTAVAAMRLRRVLGRVVQPETLAQDAALALVRAYPAILDLVRAASRPDAADMGSAS